jgi:hypothetical protein
VVGGIRGVDRSVRSSVFSGGATAVVLRKIGQIGVDCPRYVRRRSAGVGPGSTWRLLMSTQRRADPSGVSLISVSASCGAEGVAALTTVATA